MYSEKDRNLNLKRNEKYIKEFDKWLTEKKLSDKVIRKHLTNASLFINTYLNYYEPIKAEDGLDEIYGFLDDWFVRKCMWSTSNSLKETAASLKKFYQYMSDNNYVDNNDFIETFKDIRNSMDELCDNVEAYNNGDSVFLF